MSHGAQSISAEQIRSVVTAEPFEVNGQVKTILLAAVAVGIAGLVLGFLGDARATWVSVQVNFLFWFAIAAASTGFSAVIHICNAEWARPVRRLYESSSVYLLYAFVPLVALWLIGGPHLFVWFHEKIDGKELWLTPAFVYGRGLFAVVFLGYLMRRVVHYTIRRDLGAIRSGLCGVDKKDAARWMDSSYDSYLTGWQEAPEKEVAAATSRIGRLSPAVVIFYAVLMTFIAFDQIMSVDPHWFSTLFGALYFMSAVYAASAFMAILVPFACSVNPVFRALVKKSTLHDLGKLLFGFGIFWAYMFWSHYLPIWYGNIPEETGWVITRLREQPWQSFAWVTLALSFIIPFLIGLSRDVKQIPLGLALTGVIVLVGMWLQFYLLFAPTLYPHEIPLGIKDLLITLGFFGVYSLGCISFLRRVPLVPVGDIAHH
ncbi:MAG: hypothetical protein PHC51_01515 [bacterium]|nr:hypothetical protein [bacterium]